MQNILEQLKALNLPAHLVNGYAICYYKDTVIMITTDTIETGNIITPLKDLKKDLKNHLQKIT